MTRKLCRYLFLLCMVCSFTIGRAQNFLITQPIINACSGVLYDSGGLGGGYGNNESFTTVICPDQAGGRVQLAFAEFDLSTEGIPSDSLTIYDGNSTSSLRIGSYSAQLLLNLVVVTSLQNPSGCLTLVFTSNADGTGNFAASISCVLPCSAPSAAFSTAQGDTLQICQGDEVVFDGSGSTAAPGDSVISWTWSMGNTLPWTSNTAVDTVTFASSGVFILRLQVTDTSGCVSTNISEVLVLVSGAPLFTGTGYSGPVCGDEQVELFGNATPPVLVAEEIAGLDLGSGLALPDEVGTPMITAFEVYWADTGAVLTDAADLGNICIDIEHSFMADLVVNLGCPNNQSVNLHQQGGGGTYLGDANDSMIPGPGTCWTYCFNTTPDLGTWAQCAANGATPNTLPASTGIALAPGSYTSVQPLSGLLGCPLNGTWTMTITDFWGADNGTLCGWQIDGLGSIGDSSYMDLTTTLTLQDPDSAYWSSSVVDIDNAMPPNATTTLPSTGAYDCTFHVIDSYGCNYDTTVVVLRLLEPIVEAGPERDLCQAPQTLGGSVLFDPIAQCTHSLVLNDTGGNGWGAGAFLTATVNGIATSYTLLNGSSATFLLNMEGGWPIQLSYTKGTVPFGNNQQNEFQLLDPNSLMLYTSPFNPLSGIHYNGVAACSGQGGAISSWSPTVGITDPSDPASLIAHPASGWYVLSASYAGGNCMQMDSAFVLSSGGSIGVIWDEDAETLCADDASLVNYSWYLDGVLNSEGPEHCVTTPPIGEWVLVARPAVGCDLISGNLLVCPACMIIQGPDSLITTPDLGQYVWMLDGVLLNAEGSTVPLSGPGLYTVTVTSDNGCVVSASYLVEFSSVEELQKQSRLLLAPNPNKNEFRISSPSCTGDVGNLRIIDIAGRVVLDQSFANRSASGWIEVEHKLLPASYIVSLACGERTLHTRMVVD